MSGVAQVFAMWHHACQWLKHEKLYYKAKKEDNSKRKAQLTEEINTAERSNQHQKKWIISRVLGGRFRGPNKRKLNAPVEENPTLDEWAEYMKQSGPKGGMEAQILYKQEKIIKELP